MEPIDVSVMQQLYDSIQQLAPPPLTNTFALLIWSFRHLASIIAQRADSKLDSRASLDEIVASQLRSLLPEDSSLQEGFHPVCRLMILIIKKLLLCPATSHEFIAKDDQIQPLITFFESIDLSSAVGLGALIGVHFPLQAIPALLRICNSDSNQAAASQILDSIAPQLEDLITEEITHFINEYLDKVEMEQADFSSLDKMLQMILLLVSSDRMMPLVIRGIVNNVSVSRISACLRRHSMATILMGKGFATQIISRLHLLDPTYIPSIISLLDGLETEMASTAPLIAQACKDATTVIFTKFYDGVVQYLSSGDSNKVSSIKGGLSAFVVSSALHSRMTSEHISLFLQWNTILHHWEGSISSATQSTIQTTIRKIFPSFALDWRLLEQIASEFDYWPHEERLTTLKNILFHVSFDNPQSIDLQRHMTIEWLLDVITKSSASLEEVVLAQAILKHTLRHCSPQRLHDFIVHALDSLSRLLTQYSQEYYVVGHSATTLLRRVFILRNLIALAVNTCSSHFAAVAIFCVKHLCTSSSAPFGNALKEEYAQIECDTHLIDLLRELTTGSAKTERINIIADAFLALMPNATVPTYEQYADVLPRKPTFERDVAIEQILQKKPSIISVLDLISTEPLVFCRCLEIAKSLLAIMIGNWTVDANMSNSRSLTSPRRATLLMSTTILLRILLQAELLPGIFDQIVMVVPKIPACDIATLLMSLWQVIKDMPPTSLSFRTRRSIGKTRIWPESTNWALYLEPYKLILQKHVDKLAPVLLTLIKQERGNGVCL